MFGDLSLNCSLGFDEVHLFIYSVDVDDGDGPTVVRVVLCDYFGEGGVDGLPWKLYLGPIDKVPGNVLIVDTKAITNENLDVGVGFNLFIEVAGDSVLSFGCVVPASNSVDFVAFLGLKINER